MMTRRVLELIVAGLLALAVAGPAQAIPVLQLYIEGATYDADEESWVKLGVDSFRLWVVANLDGPGGQGPVSDVRLSAVFDHGLAPTLAITPGTTGDLGGFTDPSPPAAVVGPAGPFADTVPALPDGSTLPAHGEFGVGRDWVEYRLGDFGLADSPIGNFITGFPGPTAAGAQINVYDVLVSGLAPGDQVHFDVYAAVCRQADPVGGCAVRRGQPLLAGVKAPFSHDARWEQQSSDGPGGRPTVTNGTVPGPSAGLGLALGLGGWAALGRVRRRNRP